MVSLSQNDLQVQVDITTSDSRSFICTRIVLHALLASLHLTYSAVLWHVPMGGSVVLCSTRLGS